MPPGRRAVSPVVGVVSLVAVVVVLAATVGSVALGIGAPEPAPTASVAVTATDDGRVTLVHRGGATLSVGTLRVRLAVDGTPLAHQPPVPFVGAPGYRGAPTGPFNAAGDGTWTAGERATLRVAGTNGPSLAVGARLTVRLWTPAGPVARASTTVRD